MSTRSLKAAAAASVLALALMVPSALAWGGGIELEKNCSNGLGVLDATQCSYNVAAPSGEQETGDQKAANVNLAVPIQKIEQRQENEQEVDASVKNDAHQGFQIPIAAAVAVSGESKAYGHEAKVDVDALQTADAGVKGFMIVKSDTGSADIEESGNGDTKVIGGHTGNYQEAESEIKGEDAKAEAEGDPGKGGNGGDNYGANGGDVKDSGNGGWAVSATLAKAESEGGDGGTVGCCPKKDGEDNNNNDSSCCNREDGSKCCNSANGGNGGEVEVEGGKAIGGDGSATAGAGGTQKAGAGGAGASSANIALAKNVGDNASSKAWNDATSGYSTVGDTSGNHVLGGVTGGNETKGVMVGGSAANVLGVAVNQSGNVSSYSGTATQNGDPKAIAVNKIDQSDAGSKVTQTLHPNQQGWNDQDFSQDAQSNQNADQWQSVQSDKQTASGSASSKVDVKLEIEKEHKGGN